MWKTQKILALCLTACNITLTVLLHRQIKTRTNHVQCTCTLARLVRGRTVTQIPGFAVYIVCNTACITPWTYPLGNMPREAKKEMSIFFFTYSSKTKTWLVSACVLLQVFLLWLRLFYHVVSISLGDRIWRSRTRLCFHHLCPDTDIWAHWHNARYYLNSDTPHPRSAGTPYTVQYRERTKYLLLRGLEPLLSCLFHSQQN